MQTTTACKCESGLCAVRNRELPESMRLQCAAGNGASVDAMLAHIDAARAKREAERPRAKIRAARQTVKNTKAPCKTCSGKAKTLIDRIASLKNAAVDFFADGMTVATIEQQQERLAICSACPVFKDGWCDSDKGGCGCNLSLKVKARAAYCPQGKWFAHSDNYRPLVKPTRSLIFHIYPKLRAEWNWHWHIEQIRKYQSVFNGKIVIGVAVGRETATMGHVQDLFSGIRVDNWFRSDNDKLAETNTHLSMMEAVKTDDPNAIVFRYHTKGVTKQRGTVEQPWAELLWEANMDIQSVENALASHLTCGAMRSMEPLVKAKPGAFFFAGSAYWFRAKEAFERDWTHTDKTRWWVEYLPSHLFDVKDSACLLYDLTESSVIRSDHFETHIRPEWNAWRLARGIE